MSNTSISDFLEREVYPYLTPEMVYDVPGRTNWKQKTATKWRGQCPIHGKGKSGTSFFVSVGEEGMPWKCSGTCDAGGYPIHFLYGLKKGNWIKPEDLRGEDFIEAARDIAALVNKELPTIQRSPETERRYSILERRAKALAYLYNATAEALFSPEGAKALAYLKDVRNVSEEIIRSLGLGYIPSWKWYKEQLEAAGLKGSELNYFHEDGEAFGLAFKPLTGYVTFPWKDERGRPAGLYGRWPGKDVPEGNPKNTSLPNPKQNGKEYHVKASPCYLDRALAAGHKDVLMVEGTLDVAALLPSGITNAVTCVGSKFSNDQIETLKKNRIRSVTIMGDSDPGGIAGMASSVKRLLEAGIRTYVTPELPNGNDPDEYIQANGIDAFEAILKKAYRGSLFLADYKIHKAGIDLSTAQGKDEALAVYLDVDEGLTDPIERIDLSRHIAQKTGYPREVIAEKADSYRERKRKEEQRKGLDSLLQNAAKNKGKDPAKVLAELQKGVDELQREKEREATEEHSFEDVWNELASTPEGRSTGWGGLDKEGVLLSPREVMLLAARPAHGKTAAMLNILLHFLESYPEEEAVFYSYEMSQPELVSRAITILTAREYGVEQALEYKEVARIARGSGTDDRIEKAKRILEGYWDRLHVVYKPDWTDRRLVRDMKERAEKGALSVVFIDYLQLVRVEEKEARPDMDITEVMRSLKAAAVDLEVPVVAAAQIGRSAAQRVTMVEGKFNNDETKRKLREGRPTLYELRGGGSEQQADLVIGLHNLREDFKETQANYLPAGATPLDVYVLKNRNGRNGKRIELAFYGEALTITEEVPF